MNLPDISSLSNPELRTRFEALRKKESEVISDLVLHLSEIGARGYYRGLGYSSLFYYLTQGLGYSEGAAQRRIQAARCMREHPEVYEKLRAGVLSLCTVSEVAKAKASEQEHLLEQAQGKSKREVERLVALTLPAQPPKREAIRVHKVTVAAPPPGAAAALPLFEEAAPPPVAVLPPADERYTLTLEVDKEFMKLLEEAKALGGGFKNIEVLTRALQSYVAKKAPKARSEKETKEETKSTPKITTTTRLAAGRPSRYILKSVRDALLLKAGRRCTYVSADGVRCSETRGLQIEHCRPFALGGSSTEDNLSVLCGCHNRLRAEEVFGKEKLAAYRRCR